MSTNNQDLLLAQLQGEVNRVLEYTGRLFVAANSNGKTPPVAQISKVKQVFQSSNQRFHEALDQLEEELQMAKLVMRRDLALYREKSGLQNPGEANDLTVLNLPSNEVNASQREANGAELPGDSKFEDIIMEDSEPAEPQDTIKTSEEDTTAAAAAGDSEAQVSSSNEPHTESDLQMNPPETNEKPSETTLQVDTQTQAQDGNDKGEQPADDDKPPDTGTFSNTNDLDSLFGGPISAGPGDAPSFSMDPANPDDFDFDAFATNLDSNAVDNDNISALLPGLEDYANTQSNENGEPDFDALFSAPLTAHNDEQVEGENPNIPHRDSTFDDLGDLLDFNVGEFGSGMGGEGSNENDEFDFTMS